MTEIEAALCDMLGPSNGPGIGPSIGLATTDPRAPEQGLFTPEMAAIAQAVPKRRREFAAGRNAARAAMAKLGWPAQAIPKGPDRAPIWPQGIMGSIAHCDTLCIAAVTEAPYSIGLDIEPATPLEPHLENIICTEAERAWLDTVPQKTRGLRAKMIFCAKEATYKALYPLTGKMIGFQDVELHIDATAFIATTAGAEPLHGQLHGRLKQVETYILGSVLLQM